MSPIAPIRIHEADFCAEIASYSNAIFSTHPEFPFKSARIEGFGRGAEKAKRKDLRVYDNSDRLILCGEVKLPGTLEGRSPYDEELVRDAHEKADNANVQYFFTWNVNLFVLWDRKKWDVPLLDRRIREWKLGLDLDSPDDAGRPDVLAHIQKKFLPDLFVDLADICSGRRPDWPMPADDIFIRSMESHLDWPIALTRSWMLAQAEKNKSFDSKLQEWMASQDWTFVRNDSHEWFAALHRSSSSLAYLLMNRIIFYKALYDRFEDLPQLELKASAKSASDAYKNLQKLFDRAVQRSGDYEPLFYPHERDWASTLVFEAPGAIQAWRGVLRAIRGIDFRRVSSDILGRIFQRLIGPEERHRYGQHFTGDDVVDLINAFCIRSADATVIDPACGSGSFLVRAYYRKKALRPRKSHLELLSELFGCDIALYPAHLATLNLAAREINEEANYPRIARRNFLHFRPDQEFCKLPSGPGRKQIPITLSKLDAAVANPPYVRQEKIEKKEKDLARKVLEAAWPGLRISGRSDLHCYFWPAAARLLKEDGYFGFLTSSSWLDVEYGFQLQAWILQNFQLLAVMESNAEPWFPDARVKTCVAVMRRCGDEASRMGTLVKFVQFKKPLAEIIGVPPGEHETERQEAAQQLRDRIESTATDFSDSHMRIIVKQQSKLWEAGVRAGRIVGSIPLLASTEIEGEDVEVEEEGGEEQTEEDTVVTGAYAAGKWGRFVRAPDFYFDVMREFGAKFSPLGDLVTIRRGITSGCDAFFMPRDITTEALSRFETAREFRREYGVDRLAVVEGRLKIIRAGDGSSHPIESDYLQTEVHTMMKVYRPVVTSEDQDRVVLMVSDSIQQLAGTYVQKYLKYGETHTFASKKAKAVPVPKRSTCAAREKWYDLIPLLKKSFALWPKATQYRHLVPHNPDSLIANCRLYYLSPRSEQPLDELAFTAILNSTLVGFWRSFYGRYTGMEGSLDTEIVDVNLIDVPKPELDRPELRKRIVDAFEALQKRSIGPMLEDSLIECHSPERAKKIAEGPLVIPRELLQPDRHALDDAIFELLGVTDPNRREKLVDRLHKETALHFRQIRVVEIQKMEQRRKSVSRRFSAEELAADLWDAAELEDLTPLKEWIAKQPGTTAAVIIPDAAPAYLSRHAKMFDNATVYFGKDRKNFILCNWREEAELVKLLADLGVHGTVNAPLDSDECASLIDRIEERIGTAKSRFEELASTRTSLEEKQKEVVDLLLRWFVLGRPGPTAPTIQ